MDPLSYKQILKIAWPMLLANLSVPLLGLVDTAILGHLDQPIYLGAAALGAQLIGLLFWSFGFLRMGTTGFTARALGAGNHSDIQNRLQESLFFGLLIGTALLLTQQWTLPLAVQLLAGDNSELAALVLEYSTIRIWSAPATLATYALIGWLIGLQKTRQAMWILVTTNIFNIILDYLLIVGFEMNSAGAAWASLLSEYLGLMVAAVFTYGCLRQFAVQGRPLKINWLLLRWNAFAEMFRTSRHLFVRTVCLLFVFLFFARQGATLGENTLASNAILLNLLSITAYAMDGFAYAAESLCGQAWGNKNRRRFIEACQKTSVLAAAIALICSLVLVAGQPLIIGMYTDLAEVREAASSEFLWLALLPIIAIWCYQLDGIFIGVGHTSNMQNAMLAAVLFVYLPVWWLTRELGNQGLWIAFWLFHLARSLFLAVPFVRLLRSNSNYHSSTNNKKR